MRETLGETAQSWPLITADASQPSTLDAMAARTQVVVTTVGPYTRYGLPLVAACAAAGTDYADLTGEPLFIRESIDHVPQAGHGHRRANRACVRIRFRPFGSHRLRAVPTGSTKTTRASWPTPPSWSATMAGGVSGGTIASMHGCAAGGVELMRRPDVQLERSLHADPGPGGRARTRCPARLCVAARRSRSRRNWTAYWTGRIHDGGDEHANCRRSNALLDCAYGRRFEYAEHHERGPLGRWRRWPRRSLAASAKRDDGAGQPLSSTGCRAGSSTASLPKPGTGPSERTPRARPLHGRDVHHDDDRRALSGHHVPAGRPRLQGHGGVAGRERRWRWHWTATGSPDLRGVLTPAAAMGDALLARFPAAGVSLETTRLAELIGARRTPVHQDHVD